MKHRKTPFFCIYSVVFFAFASALAELLPFPGSYVLPAILSLTVTAVSFAMLFVLKKAPAVTVFVVISTLNAAALGLGLSAWFVHAGRRESALTLTLIICAATALLLLSRAVFSIPAARRHFKLTVALIVIIEIALFILYAYFFTEPYLVPLGAFVIVQWFFAAAMNLDQKDGKKTVIYATLSSFGVIVAVIAIILTIITEDESPAEAVFGIFDIIPEPSGDGGVRKKR